MKGAIAFFVVQLLLLGVLLFGDIGFDHPGKYGLDYDDLLKLLFFYVACLFVGVLYAAFRRQWKLLLAQLATPVSLWFVIFVVPELMPPLDPADYQHLVGKTRSEARETFGFWRSRISGSSGDSEFDHYDGMSILYNPSSASVRDPRAISVQAN
ncbi:hypothetical protein [Lacipirellula parvula]|uniref:Uncharacterized protein n=1 Tax=Lacipirellula parvula TaxID=2650471 RepID=A0A5K7XFS7_9BACT|nr:hypothetical protein [Lacipirellula parvula]BBO35368.1 hypothetical protein PLANPX_4980 [Lacipirellula parvula]